MFLLPCQFVCLFQDGLFNLHNSFSPHGAPVLKTICKFFLRPVGSSRRRRKYLSMSHRPRPGQHFSRLIDADAPTFSRTVRSFHLRLSGTS